MPDLHLPVGSPLPAVLRPLPLPLPFPFQIGSSPLLRSSSSARSLPPLPRLADLGGMQLTRRFLLALAPAAVCSLGPLSRAA
eukprot:679733-Amphidinium_carterae.1